MPADNDVLMQHSTKGPAGFSHDGEPFDSDENGIITIPSHLTGHARAHGFSTDIAEEKPAKVLAKGADGGKAGGKGKNPETVKPDVVEGADGGKAGGGK